MFYNYDIYINDISCISKGMYPLRRPDINAPAKKYNEFDIPGRDGKLYQDLGVYDDVTFPIEFNYMSNMDLWHHKFREFKKLLNSCKKLCFGDDADFFHIVKKVEIQTNERTSRKIGKFTVNFVSDPYYYHKAGTLEYEPSQVLYNHYDTSKPTYIIKGEGVCHLYVNGTDVICNIGQNLIIDTTLEMSYREDKILQNSAINADYKDLWLLEGKNNISISDGFDLKIIPNWRCI